MMEGQSMRVVESSKSEIPSSWEVGLPRFRQRQVRPSPLPTISESRVFYREEDNHRTSFNSKLLKTRQRTGKRDTKLTRHFEDNDVPEDEQPLLGTSAQTEKGGSKPKRGRGWKLAKKGVRIAMPRSPRRLRLRSLKILSPLVLLRKMRDAYVRAMSSLGGQLNQKAWYSVGARAM